MNTVESAAQDMNAKKRPPIIRPPAMLLNIFGSVTNTSPGPDVGSTPNVKHAGKIIIPDTIAIKVSSAVTLTDSPRRVLSLPI